MTEINGITSDDSGPGPGHGHGDSVSDDTEATNNSKSKSPVDTKKNKHMLQVMQLISNVKNNGARSLDLSGDHLDSVPEEVLDLSHLEYLYLEGNQLTSLPDNFFDCLPALQWLDLRNNQLKSIPSLYVGRHQCLRNLLLDHNNLRALPLELGLIPTLNGLNISNNPLEFPPKEVIERGTAFLLQFFRDLLKAKSEGRLLTPDILLGRLHIGDTSDNDSQSSGELNHSRNSRFTHDGAMYPGQYSRSMSRESQASSQAVKSDLGGPVHQQMSLQRPPSYNDFRQEQYEKFKKAGALGVVRQKSKKGKKRNSVTDWRVNQYPAPPPADRVEERYAEERRLARLRELKEKQDLVLQRRKDQDRLKNWRDDGKRMQQQKYMKSLRDGGIEYTEPIRDAPFGYDEDHIKVPTNQERIAQDVKEHHEKIRRALSPRSLHQIEEARLQRDRELEKRIKLHSLSMKDRRNQPKGTPQQEMEAARRELEVAEQLQREIEQRRKDLEYRFTAFTGDVSIPSRSKRKH